MAVQRRNTKQRKLVLDAVRQSYNHPTADEIYNAVREQDDKISRGTVAGETVSHDVSGGVMRAKVTIDQTEDTEPTLTAGENWEISQPLTCDNPDEDYPVWTAELVKFLTSTEPAL